MYAQRWELTENLRRKDAKAQRKTNTEQMSARFDAFGTYATHEKHTVIVCLLLFLCAFASKV